jgi:monoamine oxidase
VLAVPVNVMAAIELDPPFSPERLGPLTQGHACHMQKLWMLATGVPDRMLGAGWGSPFYWLSAEHRLPEPDGVQIVVGFTLQNAIDPEDRDAVERALRCYAPEATVLAVDWHDWNADPWARGGWMSPPPGWASAGVRTVLRQPHGRIVMAGSDVAPEHGGWIAGAVTSGRHAATTVLARLR